MDPDIRDLLRGMLEFNPYFRLSAKEALDSKVFDKIRNRYFEQPCPIKISHKIHSTKNFDYSTGKSNKYEIKDYKKMLLKEIKILKESRDFDPKKEHWKV